MRENLLQGLQQRGMSEKEAQVYLTVFELGSAQASTIARRAGLKRPTVYSILQDFITQGIAKKIHTPKSTVYHVSDPEQVVQQKQYEFQHKTEMFSSLIGDFASIKNSYANKPSVHYYEGVVGLKNLYLETLHAQEGICAFLGRDVVDPSLKKWLKETYVHKRINKKIFAKVLAKDTPETQDYAGLDADYYKETRLIQHQLFTIDCEINLYDGKVALLMFSTDQMGGVLIENTYLYTTLKSFFDIFWESSRQGEEYGVNL